MGRELLDGFNAERLWVSIRRLVGSIRDRPREAIDQLVANCVAADSGLGPPKSLVVVPFLERLPDVVDGDELCPLHTPDVRGDVLGTDILVGEFDESAFDE